MNREIIIDVTPLQTRIAILEDGILCEYHAQSREDTQLSGNIYMGKVENVLKGMQAAFVDIGEERNAYLYYDDIPNNGEKKEINKLVKPGDQIMVQVTKEESGLKGARVSANIMISGNYVILTVKDGSIGVSHKISDPALRNHLKNELKEYLPDEYGCIVRTAAQNAGVEEIKEELSVLINRWDQIKKAAVLARPGTLIYNEEGTLYSILKDVLNESVSEIVVNDKDLYSKIKNDPKLGALVRYSDAGAALFERYRIEKELVNATQRKVWLKNGEYLIIDSTEALTVIDVNSGKFTGSKSMEETALQTNLHAAEEIARQLRLRNIGGIIIIDFIDMQTEDYKNRVIAKLKEAMQFDRSKYAIMGITKLGLLEMTRQKTRKTLSSLLQCACPVCQGNGYISNAEAMLEGVRGSIIKALKNTDTPALAIRLEPALAQKVIECEELSQDIHQSFPDRSVIIIPENNLNDDEYVLSYAKSSSDIKAFVKEGKEL